MRWRRLSHFSVSVALVLLAGCARELGSRFETPVFAAVKVVFMGDSITYYWGPGQQGDSNAFTVNSTWVDAGIYGETSGQMLSRFQQDVIALNPAIVHIMAGTNDVYPGWVLCGGTQDVDTCGNIEAMVAMAKAAGIQVILGTIPPWGPGSASSYFDPSPARYDRINALNQWITQFAVDNGLTLIDYHGLLVSSDGNTYVPDLTVDGIHPSALAYTLMTPVAERAILDVRMK
ncbi:MAG TPA: GDSL-type esterase/lipase family protein [Acidobacteriaceae bacterium]|nr:GDSL-type esterase/lipase family protein [Acidobacteriaceae bacterium]